MSKKAGQLLWSRRQLILPAGATIVDTGLTQVSKAFPPGEPSLGASLSSPPSSTGVASRVAVLPQAPLSTWANITHGEPYVDPTTGNVMIQFTNGGGSATVNVLLVDPHTVMGPGASEGYAP